jgi:hypothetical protein
MSRTRIETRVTSKWLTHGLDYRQKKGTGAASSEEDSGCRRPRLKRISAKDKGRSERPAERKAGANFHLDKATEIGYSFSRGLGLGVSNPALRYGRAASAVLTWARTTTS